MLLFNVIPLNNSTVIFFCYIILSISFNQQYFSFDTILLDYIQPILFVEKCWRHAHWK